MRVNSQTQAPPQPVREQQNVQIAREQAMKVQQKAQEKPPEPPKRPSNLGNNIDTQA